MAGNRLGVPQIGVDTTNSSSTLHPSSASNSENHTAQSLLVPASPQSPTSLDGATLRSRSGSFTSSADTVGRSRANSWAGSSQTSGSRLDLHDVSPEEALRPDPGNEADFEVERNPFAFSPGQLGKLLNPKSLAAFKALGGLRGIAAGLRTDVNSGLSVDEGVLDGAVSFDDAVKLGSKGKGETEKPPLAEGATSSAHAAEGAFEDRIRVFKDNRLPERKGDGIFKLLWQAYNDKILILLTVAAVVSLALGIYESIDGTSKVDWVEGVAICVAILVVTIVTAMNDWQKERQFVKLNKRKDDRLVKVIRSGKSQQISVFDISVGEVLLMEPGDLIPADGIFIQGHNVKCDESSATGESDQMHKMGGDIVWQQIQDGTATSKSDPFIISGSKVIEGVGSYLVTGVGVNSSFGKILLSLQTENDPTPLQVKLAKLADWIGGLGTGAAGLLFFILLFRFLAQLSGNNDSAAVKGKAFVDILITAITVIVVAIPEGLPLAVTLALAFATTKMLKENNLVRVLRACETMGNATVICSDKTGTLTQNKMTVVAGTWSVSKAFSQIPQSEKQEVSFSESFESLPKDFQETITQGIVLNSTAFEGEEDGKKTFLGSKTEVALLQLVHDNLGINVAEQRSNTTIVQLIPFDSARKVMGVVVRTSTGQFRLYVKGASEIVLAHTSLAADASGAAKPLTDEDRRDILTTIDVYARRSLRTIGMAYRDFEAWPPLGAKTADGNVEFDDIFQEMIWAGVVGIQDPLRPEVPNAIKVCHGAGVDVKMVTGDNLQTAAAIAKECGILEEDGIVMEGPKFRKLSEAEMDAILPKLRVLARSSPEDKRILVTRLKRLGETVAVTGDGTNDGPALKAADVGFSMGIAGTEVAKEASSIILLDDNFKSIITAISWGRAVNAAVKKFLQFQITVNITAVLLTFVSALASSEGHSVLTAVQLLWVNLVMDTFAALALATDPPNDAMLLEKPSPKSAPLFTPTMWKMIIGQAIYQLIFTFILYFAGIDILHAFGYTDVDPDTLQAQLNTIVFNTFVWMQIFNEFNNRRLDNKFNIFEGIHRNFWFIGINCIMVAGQIMIVFVGGEAFNITKIDGTQWAICLVCAIFCLPFAVLIRCLPDRQFEICFNFVVKVFAAIWAPISTVLGAVFRPVGKAMSAVKRTIKRMIKRGDSGADDEETKNAPIDEEATMPIEESKTQDTVRPTTSPADVPVVTLTTA